MAKFAETTKQFRWQNDRLIEGARGQLTLWPEPDNARGWEKREGYLLLGRMRDD